MKDLCEYKLIFGLVKGWDIEFAGHRRPNVIADENNICLWL